MTRKNLTIFLALFVTMAGYADPIKGETVSEREARIKRMSEEEPRNRGRYNAPDTSTIRQPLTLLGKEICEQRFGPTQKVARFFFGNGGSITNIIAEKNIPCCTIEEQFDKAKLGMTMSLSEWKDFLTHRNEERCMGLKSITPKMEMQRHEFRWRIVRE